MVEEMQTLNRKLEETVSFHFLMEKIGQMNQNFLSFKACTICYMLVFLSLCGKMHFPIFTIW